MKRSTQTRTRAHNTQCRDQPKRKLTQYSLKRSTQTKTNTILTEEIIPNEKPCFSVPVLSLVCLFSPVFKYCSAAVIPVVEPLAEIFSFLLFLYFCCYCCIFKFFSLRVKMFYWKNGWHFCWLTCSSVITPCCLMDAA